MFSRPLSQRLTIDRCPSPSFVAIDCCVTPSALCSMNTPWNADTISIKKRDPAVAFSSPAKRSSNDNGPSGMTTFSVSSGRNDIFMVPRKESFGSVKIEAASKYHTSIDMHVVASPVLLQPMRFAATCGHESVKVRKPPKDPDISSFELPYPMCGRFKISKILVVTKNLASRKTP